MKQRVLGTLIGVVVWSVVVAWAQSYQVVDLGNAQPADLNSQWIVGMYRPTPPPPSPGVSPLILTFDGRRIGPTMEAVGWIGAINAHNVMVGGYESLGFRPVIWGVQGLVSRLQGWHPASDITGGALDVNDAGVIAGTIHDARDPEARGLMKAVVWFPGSPIAQRLADYGRHAWAYAVNNDTVVVGAVQHPNGQTRASWWWDRYLGG